jgi:hypothetical protein
MCRSLTQGKLVLLHVLKDRVFEGGIVPLAGFAQAEAPVLPIN